MPSSQFSLEPLQRAGLRFGLAGARERLGVRKLAGALERL
jgi:hypothetical protein